MKSFIPKTIPFISFFLAAMLTVRSSDAQEYAVPLPAMQSLPVKNKASAAKPTALSLPFFDDFTGYDVMPDPTLWKDHLVYISNTMSAAQKSRGMAVFDANNARTVPYDSLNPFHRVWADSLTSQDIDLSGYAPSDSLWLSFYYEPGGNGYLPKDEDSLVVFFYNSQEKWVRVWETGGDTALNFKHIMIPVKDTGYFNDHFAFRFVNKATHGISNSDWILDYVYLNANRSFQEPFRADLAFTKNTTNLLNDFTAMPFNQFKTNPGQFLADSLHAFLSNNSVLPTTANVGYEAEELLTGTNFGQATGSTNLSGQGKKTISFPMFPLGNFTPPSSSNGKVIVRTKYYTDIAYPGEPVQNDTIQQEQVFGNYFAYDDGSAEKAYFLNVFQNAPGITAIEYALYAPDTIRGVSIYFPRTVPPSSDKEFSLIVYKHIAINGGTDQIVYQQDYYLPHYADTINHFTTYAFDTPVAMDTGIYYIGIMQSAGGFSDSLYIGLDVNRENGNHRYYNVYGYWEPSTISGALLVRPIVGGPPLPSSGIVTNQKSENLWKIFPNPTHNLLHIDRVNYSGKFNYMISDALGRTLVSGKLKLQQTTINVTALSPGLYFLRLTDNKGAMYMTKFIRK